MRQSHAANPPPTQNHGEARRALKASGLFPCIDTMLICCCCCCYGLRNALNRPSFVCVFGLLRIYWYHVSFSQGPPRFCSWRTHTLRHMRKTHARKHWTNKLNLTAFLFCLWLQQSISHRFKSILFWFGVLFSFFLAVITIWMKFMNSCDATTLQTGSRTKGCKVWHPRSMLKKTPEVSFSYSNEILNMNESLSFVNITFFAGSPPVKLWPAVYWLSLCTQFLQSNHN